MTAKQVEAHLRRRPWLALQQARLTNRLRALNQSLELLAPRADMPMSQLNAAPAGRHAGPPADPTGRAAVANLSLEQERARLLEQERQARWELAQVEEALENIDLIHRALPEEDRELVALRCFALRPPSYNDLAGQWARMHPDDPERACVSPELLRKRMLRLFTRLGEGLQAV